MSKLMMLCGFLLAFFALDNFHFEVLSNGSPDIIAYVSVAEYNTDIYLFDLQTGSKTRLTFDNVRDYAPTWSPDGCFLAYVSYSDIHLLDISNGLSVNLTASLVSDSDATFYNYPSWSPDGSHLAFASNAGEGFLLYVMDINGNSSTAITDSNLTVASSSWFPDGDRLAFSAENEEGNQEIFSIQVDGGNLHNISNHDEYDTDPSLSPDGSKIAFSTNRDDNWEIYTMNIDGSNPIRLTFNEGVDRQPDWSPDGERIAFSSNRSGSWEIYAINHDGTGLEQITIEPFITSQSPRWQPTYCES